MTKYVDLSNPVDIAKAYLRDYIVFYNQDQFYTLLAEAPFIMPLSVDEISFELFGMIQRTFTSKKLEDTIAALKIIGWQEYKKLKINPEGFLCLKNGVVDLYRGEFFEGPGEGDTVFDRCLNLEYDEEAYSPKVDAFLDRALPDAETRELLEEIIGCCLFYERRVKKAFLLHGPTSTGKTVLLQWIGDLLGENNISTTSLEDLNRRFGLQQIVGKMASLGDDLPKHTIKGSSLFRSLAESNRRDIETKHGETSSVGISTKFIFASNNFPRMDDLSPQTLRRWLILPFKNQIFPGDKNYESHLDELVKNDPVAKSYFFTLALKGLRRYLSRGYLRETEVTKKEWISYKLFASRKFNSKHSTAVVANESDLEMIQMFAHDCLRLTKDGWVTKQAMRRLYEQWCADLNYHPLGTKKFAQAIRDAFGGQVKECRKRFDSANQKVHAPRIWSNIRSRVSLA